MHLDDSTRSLQNDSHETELGGKLLELYGMKFCCATTRKDVTDELTRLLMMTSNAVELVKNTVLQYKSKGIPVPNGESVEGLMGFPFV